MFIDGDKQLREKGMILTGRIEKSELGRLNREELESLSWAGWDRPSLLQVYVINALLTTMGITASNGDMEKIIRFAFGDAELDKRTGNTGFTIKYGLQRGEKTFRTVVPVASLYDGESAFNQESPLIARSINDRGTIEILVGDKTRVEAEVQKAPSWYNKKYSIDDQMFFGSQLVQWENGVLMLAVPEKNGKQVCAYLGKRQNACKFCGLEQGKYKPLTPEVLADIVRINLREQGCRTSLTMTGGNKTGKNRGFDKYIPFVQRLRQEFGPDLPIQLEISPPSRECVDFIIDNKLSFMANIEVWDDETRQYVIPAKARAIPREEYLEVFSYLNSRGIDTYSVLITSLQPFEYLYEGVEELAKIGTSTIVLPFRPSGGSIFEEYRPTRATDLLRATIGAAMIMGRYNTFLDRKPKEYCSGCGGCGADANLRDNDELWNDKRIQRFVRKYCLDRLLGGK